MGKPYFPWERRTRPYKKHRGYSPEFKRNAAAMRRITKRSKKDIDKELDATFTALGSKRHPRPATRLRKRS